MARKSKQTAASAEAARFWNTALYIRLSREDGDKEESDSIANQRDLLYDYVHKMPDLKVVDCFTDDGFTGTNFDRPGFQAMMTGVRNKEIDCVIVKDLSRLGRNYIEAGNYIEQIFPFLDVRFISVVDMLDSVRNPTQMNTVMIPFKNLMNDEYCRDISNKVRSSLDIRRKQGNFIGSFASYGYLKDPEKKGRLMIDENVAEVIRDIFGWFLNGHSILGIAKRLNEQGIPNPSAYKRQQGFNYRHPYIDRCDSLWPDSSVRRILTNRLYVGDLVQGRHRIKSYKVQRSVSVPQNEWIIVENTHEAIIDREKFMTVQGLLGRDTRVAPRRQELYLFSGFVRCADCGKAMNRRLISQPYADYHYYVCSTFKKMSKDACTKHTMRSDRVESMVLAAIRKQIELAVSMDELIARIESSCRSNRHSSRLNAALAGHERERMKIETYKGALYEDWKNGDITREEYHQMKVRYDERSDYLTDTISRLNTEKKELFERGAAENEFVSGFIKHQNISRLTRDIVVQLIDMIYIHEGGNITIQFKFEDEFKKAVEYIENNRDAVQTVKRNA